MFKRLEGDTAVVSVKGAYKQGDLYEWNGGLFAKIGSSFYRLKGDGATSKTDLKVCMIYREAPLYADRFGRLCTLPGPDRKQVLATADGTFIESDAAGQKAIAAE